jgi:hypothetical protein
MMLLSTIACIAVVGTAAHEQLNVHQVHGLIVVSSDRQLVAKVRKEYTFAMPFPELAEKFREDRFVLEPWGQRSAVLVDRGSGPIKEFEQRLQLADAFLASVGPDLTLAIGDLPPEQRQKVLAYLQRFRPAATVPRGVRVEDGSVGLDASIVVTARGQGRSEPVTLSMSIYGEAISKRNDVLNTRPIPMQDLRSLRAEDRDRAMTEFLTEDRLGNELTMHMIGTARANLAEGMREVSRMIDEIYLEMNTRELVAANELAKKLDLGEGVGPGEMNLNQLPEQMRKDALHSIGVSWRAHGFGSQEEAEAFLLNSSSVQVGTHFGLRYMLRPRTEERPGSSIVYVFSQIRGVPHP